MGGPPPAGANDGANPQDSSSLTARSGSIFFSVTSSQQPNVNGALFSINPSCTVYA